MKLIATNGDAVGLVLSRDELLHLLVCWNAVQHGPEFAKAFSTTQEDYPCIADADLTAAWHANTLRNGKGTVSIADAVEEVLRAHRER